MTFEEAMESLKLKFTSGNPIEVERATILRKEWEALLPVLNKPFQPSDDADPGTAALDEIPELPEGMINLNDPNII